MHHHRHVLAEMGTSWKRLWSETTFQRKPNVESFVVDMVASVLDGENILNLLPAAKLDIVDADGAILLYDRPATCR
jgi:hypothetical protein